MATIPSDLDRPRLLTLPDGRTWVAASEPDLRFSWEEIFERHAYGEAASFVRPGGTVVDAGAHVGLSSLYFLERTAAARIIACEPAATTFRCLAANFAGNERVRPLEVALGQAVGTRRFTYYPKAPTQSGLYADPDRDRAATRAYLLSTDYTERAAHLLTAELHEAASEDVETVTLSSLVDRLGIGRIDLLKIDVERAEEEVLAGVEPRHWPRVRAVAVEIHDLDGRLARCAALLGDLGFRFRARQEPWLAGSELYSALAVREDS